MRTIDWNRATADGMTLLIWVVFIPLWVPCALIVLPFIGVAALTQKLRNPEPPKP